MKKGDKVVCINADGRGNPLKFGDTYTIGSYGPPPPHLVDDPKRLSKTSVTVLEVRGLFRADRFEPYAQK